MPWKNVSWMVRMMAFEAYLILETAAFPSSPLLTMPSSPNYLSLVNLTAISICVNRMAR